MNADGVGVQAAENAGTVDETTLTLDDAAAPEAVRGGTTSSSWAIFRMVLVLALVAAAVYGIVFFLRKLAKPSSYAGDPHLKVLASAHLGSNRFVHVVSLGDKAWLIGASDGGVNLVAELDDKETLDTLLLDDSRRGGGNGTGLKGDFQSILRRLTGGGKSGSGGQVPSAGSVRGRRERLHGL